MIDKCKKKNLGAAFLGNKSSPPDPLAKNLKVIYAYCKDALGLQQKRTWIATFSTRFLYLLGIIYCGDDKH